MSTKVSSYLQSLFSPQATIDQNFSQTFYIYIYINIYFIYIKLSRLLPKTIIIFLSN